MKGPNTLLRQPLHRFTASLVLAALTAYAARAAAVFPEAEVLAFTDRHCSSCHNDVDKEGGLDLTNLGFVPTDPANFLTWVKVHDRVQAGEMPPKEKKRPEAGQMGTFLKTVAVSLTATETEKAARDGRATERRLNRYEYENALRDLLHAPWVQVKDMLPEDGEAFRYNKSSRALDVSHVHMARYMNAADYVMRQAMSAQLQRPERTVKRYYSRDIGTQRNFDLHEFNTYPDRLTFPVLDAKAQPEVRLGKAPVTVGEADPETREREALGKVASIFSDAGGYSWSQFRAPAAGRYLIRFKGYTIWVGPGANRTQVRGAGANKKPVDLPFQWFRPNVDDVSKGRRDEPIGVYASQGRVRRRVGEFDIGTEPTVGEVDVILSANEVIQADALRFIRLRVTGDNFGSRNPLAQIDGMPGYAMQWMEVDGPIYDENTGAGYRTLFGDLPLKRLPRGQDGLEIDVVAEAAEGRGRRGGGGGEGGRGGTPLTQAVVDVESTDQPADAGRLLRSFMQRAYRRPVEERDVQRFLTVINGEFKTGRSFAEAMLAGYTAVLASPGFVFVEEKPGRLDDHALATRLALFLWNSEPDATLRTLAQRGELRRPEVMRAQADRMLADPRSRRFVDAFIDYWLDIRKMDDTSPSSTLYNDYELDDPLKDATLLETRLFFAELLREDLPARNMVDSDFTFLNERLALHYGVPGVKGAAMRRVKLPADSLRGGLMTQASVLKVTANGTTTSPVLRGVWITERILGQSIPPPPASVPAVEPDIRGAVTIRQQLEKHRADEACAACHRKIDAPGFALESFDVMGGWRNRYRAESPDVEPERGFGINGWAFAFHYAQPVDPSGQLADGQPFRDVRDLKKLLLQDETQLARNLARQLAVYATGAPVRFADREAIEKILRATAAKGHGVRSLVHELIRSDLFLNK